eukprot:COSAG01_NODE_18220_length_1091_cov_73.586694_2_plen_38_part_01
MCDSSSDKIHNYAHTHTAPFSNFTAMHCFGESRHTTLC